MKQEYLSFDVMIGDKYICTLKMPHPHIFVLDMDKVAKFVISKRPTLRNKDFRVMLN